MAHRSSSIYGPEGTEEDGCDGDYFSKKDKKLVFLARTVFDKVRSSDITNGTKITNEILPLYQKFCDVSMGIWCLQTVTWPANMPF